tara:strand:- start:19273 stop:19593 length:321 start_codon:yes stop_codon:yes gene_type:complete
MYTNNVFIAIINNQQESLISDFSIDLNKLTKKTICISAEDFDEFDNKIEHNFEVSFLNAKNIDIEENVFDENDNEFFIFKFSLNEDIYELHFPIKYLSFFKTIINY